MNSTNRSAPVSQELNHASKEPSILDQVILYSLKEIVQECQRKVISDRPIHSTLEVLQQMQAVRRPHALTAKRLERLARRYPDYSVCWRQKVI